MMNDNESGCKYVPQLLKLVLVGRENVLEILEIKRFDGGNARLVAVHV